MLLSEPSHAFVADAPGEVKGVLRAAEDAARAREASVSFPTLAGVERGFVTRHKSA